MSDLLPYGALKSKSDVEMNHILKTPADNGTGYFFDNGLLEMGPIMTYNQQWA